MLPITYARGLAVVGLIWSRSACTYHEGRDSTFDFDPSLSCYDWFSLWGVYALIAIPGCLMVLIWASLASTLSMVGHLGRRKAMFDPAISQLLGFFLCGTNNQKGHQQYPASLTYAALFTSSKVATTIINTMCVMTARRAAVSVALFSHTILPAVRRYLRWYPQFALKTNAMIFAGLFAYVLTLPAYHHSFMNRFAAYGLLTQIITHYSAYKAIEVDDPFSSVSKDIFVSNSLIALVAYVVIELALTVVWVAVAGCRFAPSEVVDDPQHDNYPDLLKLMLPSYKGNGWNIYVEGDEDDDDDDDI